jgi:hypothetical protein
MQMQNSIIRAAIILVAVTIVYGASATAQNTNKVTVPAGTRLLIRTVDALDSSKQKAGYRFTASLETNLQSEDMVVPPRGNTVYGVSQRLLLPVGCLEALN